MANQQQPPMKVQIKISKDKIILGDLKYIPLSKIKLDPENARFKHLERTLSDQEIEEWISNEGDTRSLIREIKFSNGLSELPYAQDLEDGNFKVIEGNRRIVCLRMIAEKIKSGKEQEMSLAMIDPVQCIVIPKEVNDELLAIFLARTHVSGKKEWAALNQSAYVYDLIQKYHYDQDDVVESISLSKTKVNNMIKSYETTLKYRVKYPDDDLWLRRYSHFEELYKKKGLKEWISDPQNLDLFMKWVHNNQFPMAIKVRKLEGIIQDGKDAYKAMKKGANIDEATEVLQQQEKTRTLTAQIAGDVEVKVKDFQELLQNFPRGKMKEYSKDKDRMQEFEALYSDFGEIIKDIKSMKD